MASEELTRKFFHAPTIEIAKSLLGMELYTRDTRDQVCGGVIVEVEAYHSAPSFGDEACHCFRGKTQRNEVMFLTGGHCYVYLIYGIHQCVNIVTEEEGIGAAVLIRAIAPFKGLEIIRSRREGTRNDMRLCSSPGNVSSALGITAHYNGLDLLSSNKIWIRQGSSSSPSEIETSTRVGISKAAHLPWRFFIRGHPAVSKVRVRYE